VTCNSVSACNVTCPNGPPSTCSDGSFACGGC
jgi:hypothetical protein